jgi:hypothetical protein
MLALSVAALWSTSANAWCERDCVAVCKITAAHAQSGSVQSCTRRSQCESYRGGKCEGPKAAAERALEILRANAILKGMFRCGLSTRFEPILARSPCSPCTGGRAAAGALVNQQLASDNRRPHTKRLIDTIIWMHAMRRTSRLASDGLPGNGIEPSTVRQTTACSTAELPGTMAGTTGLEPVAFG